MRGVKLLKPQKTSENITWCDPTIPCVPSTPYATLPYPLPYLATVSQKFRESRHPGIPPKRGTNGGHTQPQARAWKYQYFTTRTDLSTQTNFYGKNWSRYFWSFQLSPRPRNQNHLPGMYYGAANNPHFLPQFLEGAKISECLQNWRQF